MSEKSASADTKLLAANQATDDQFYDTISGNLNSPESAGATGGSVLTDDDVRQREEWEEELRKRHEWEEQLAKLQDEILTLRQVLAAKVRASAELKHKLGISPMTEMKEDLRKGVNDLKATDAYKKTNETLQSINERIVTSQAYQKTSEKVSEVSHKIAETPAYQKTNAALKTVGNKTGQAFNAVGGFTSKKLGEMRNSTAFKSMEEKVGGAYNSVKSFASESWSSATSAEHTDLDPADPAARDGQVLSPGRSARYRPVSQ